MFCTIHSPGFRSSEWSRASALNGIESSWAAVSSLIASGTGTSAAALADEELGPRAEGAAGDPLPDLQAVDAFAQRVDDADRLGARCGRQFGLEAVGAADRPEVVIVDG